MQISQTVQVPLEQLGKLPENGKKFPSQITDEFLKFPGVFSLLIGLEDTEQKYSAAAFE